MLIIADNRIPLEAKNKLEKYGKLVLLKTSGITENSISGHPDIFFLQYYKGIDYCTKPASTVQRNPS